jgi:GNAT superfamily N-acetyltransferase
MYDKKKVIFKAEDYSAVHLGEDDIPDLQDLLEKASDYELLISGEPPSPWAAQELLEDCPPGKTLDDKFTLGIIDGSAVLVGVMDVVRDYPEPGVWWIGLLLFDPIKRSHGMGQVIYNSFEQWAAQSGASQIGLGVVEKNFHAARFWSRLGFVTLERKSQHLGKEDQVILGMRRWIV